MSEKSLSHLSAKELYQNKSAIVTTQHGKDKLIERPFLVGLGLVIKSSKNIDTDQLGTFTGEIKRKDNPLKTVIKKARLGMNRENLPIGIANEGSFGPHPELPFIPASEEIMVFVDDELGIEISEKLFSVQTNFNQAECSSITELNDFLERIKFPSHALAVRPVNDKKNVFGLFKTNVKDKTIILKGIREYNALEQAIKECQKNSGEKLVRVETDMRAHMNPTRQMVIRKLAIKLIRRLNEICVECGTPGWGLTDVIKGLPCEICKTPSDWVLGEVYSCSKCDYRVTGPRPDGLKSVEVGYCNNCNG